MNARWERVGLFAPRAEADARLGALLGARELCVSPRPADAVRLDAVAAFAGSRGHADAARFARTHGLPLLTLRDGFLRSIGRPEDGAPRLSLLVDDLGRDDDPSRPSRLERRCQEAEISPAHAARAAAVREAIVRSEISSTNRAPAGERPEPDGAAPRVLVVPGSSVPGADDALDEMIEEARREHPEAEIVVESPRAPALPERLGVVVDRELVSPTVRFAGVVAVYVVDSFRGFEALLRGIPVRCFGGPFYAGWGLTRDRLAFPRRTRRRGVDELVAIALVDHARYVDPERGVACEVERVIEHLALQRALYEANARRLYAIGFSRWKRAFLPSFLESPGRAPVFARDAAEAARKGFSRGDVALVWGARPAPSVARLAETRGGEVHHVEDGFLRSLRLGAEIEAPASIVVDTRGIYFDPTRPSDLERMLSSASLSERELARARALREAMCRAKVSKYNLGARRSPDIPAHARGSVVLVPGQVEDDASIELGGVDVRTNLELLREVRRARPDAFVVYKPHPDVWGGHRRGAVEAAEAERLADLVVTDLGLPECLEVADEVHTMTSLVGFEALVRGLPVFTYGLPFYAGWGLTTDRHSLSRRARRLSIDELVACALIRYPRYRAPGGEGFASPEFIVEELERARREAGDLAVREGPVARLARKVANVIRTLRDAR